MTINTIRAKRRAAVDKNIILIAVSVVILVAAGGMLIWRSSGEAVEMTDAQAQAPMPMQCPDCGHEWTVPYKEYLVLIEEAQKNNTKIPCPKCGKSDAWREPVDMGLEANLTDADRGAAMDFTAQKDNNEEVAAEGQPTDDGSVVEEPQPKPKSFKPSAGKKKVDLN